MDAQRLNNFGKPTASRSFGPIGLGPAVEWVSCRPKAAVGSELPGRFDGPVERWGPRRVPVSITGRLRS